MLSVFMDCLSCKTYKELNLLLTLLPKSDFFCRFPLSSQNKLDWPSNLTVLALCEPEVIKQLVCIQRQIKKVKKKLNSNSRHLASFC